MPNKKGGYIPIGITEKQLINATKEDIKIKNNESILVYEKKGYTINDRNKLFNNYIKNKEKKFIHTPGRYKDKNKHIYKIELPKVDLDNIMTNVNGGCTRLVYY